MYSIDRGGYTITKDSPMRLRDQVALTLPTLFLRLVLGVTFLWAGTGKLLGTYSVTGIDAARLANIGVMPTPIQTTPPEAQTDIQSETQTESESKPDPIAEPAPADEPINPLPDLNEQANEIIEAIEEQLDSETADTPDPVINEPKFEFQSVQHSNTVYAASDFPDEMEVKRVYSLALMIAKAAAPGLTKDSQPIDPILPSKLAYAPWPTAFAWAAAVTEIAAGAFLILGFMTRVSAVSTLSIMLVAMWMTQFGPAAIQSTDAILGFIPSKSDPWAPGAYSNLLWQLALAAMSGAVFFLGSGALGIDRILFKPSHRDPYVHGDPKAGKTTKASQQQTPQDRGEFDRTPNPTP